MPARHSFKKNELILDVIAKKEAVERVKKKENLEKWSLQQ